MKKLRWICAITCAAALFAGTAWATVDNSEREAAVERKIAESMAAESTAAESGTGEETAFDAAATTAVTEDATENTAESASADGITTESQAAGDVTAESASQDADASEDGADHWSKVSDMYKEWEKKLEREISDRGRDGDMTGKEDEKRPEDKPEYGEERNMNDMSTVTVSASGSVKLVPDKAEFVFGVTGTDEDAAWAQRKNSETVDKVVEKLKELGVDEKSITTTGYSIYPQYDYSGDTREITGYEVRTTLTVKDQSIDEAGGIISECVEAGINDFDYINFLCSDYEEAYQEALTQAVKAARKKAEVMAEAAGMKLDSVVTLTEGYQDTSASYTRSSGTAAMAANDSASAMSLMAGESEITAQVTVTYTMR